MPEVKKNSAYSINKSGGKSVKIKLNEFHGKRYLDIREYYTNESNEEVPTKKGISVSIEDADLVLKYIQNVINDDEKTKETKACQF